MGRVRHMSKKIGIVSAYFPPHMGGVEQFSASLAQELAFMGHHVVILTCNNEGSAPHEVVSPGIEVYRLPCRSLLGDRLPLLKHGRELDAMRREVQALDLDGMLINTRFYQTTPFALALSKSMGLRALVLDHGSSYVGFGVPGVDAVVHAYERWMTGRAKAFEPDFYGISAMSVEWLRHFGIEARGVIHNAIDVAEFDALASARDFRSELAVSAGSLLVAFTGRILAAKGIWKILDVARAVEEQGVQATFVLAGDGPDKQKAQQLAPRSVQFVGRIGREDVSALLHQADLFLFPSDTEGMPTSVLEASACGVSSIATNVGGIRELLPSDEYGIVLEKADVSVIAEHIVWYSEHKDELKQRGCRCRDLVEREFSWRSVAESVLNACAAACR